MSIQTIPIEQIVIPEVRSNAVYAPEKWAEFVDSIKNQGIQFRPSCRQLPEGKIELVDGLHRILAWKELGHQDIEVEIETMTDEQAAVKHIVANHQRGESDPVGLSKLIVKLKEQGKSAAEIAKLVGYSESTVRQYAVVASIPEQFQIALTQGKLKMAHLKEVSRLDDPNDMAAALGYAIQFQWSASILHHAVENRLAEINQPLPPQGAMPAEAIVPQQFDPQLAQYRQCLSCGSNSPAQDMSYWQICKGCHDALMYLKQIDRLPWSAIEKIVAEREALIKENEELNKKLAEAAKQIIDLSMRIGRETQQQQQVRPWNPNPTPAAQQIQNTQSWGGIQKQ